MLIFLQLAKKTNVIYLYWMHILGFFTICVISMLLILLTVSASFLVSLYMIFSGIWRYSLNCVVFNCLFYVNKSWHIIIYCQILHFLVLVFLFISSCIFITMVLLSPFGLFFFISNNNDVFHALQMHLLLLDVLLFDVLFM